MKAKFRGGPRSEFNNIQNALRQMVESGWLLPRDLMPAAMNEILLPIDLLDLGPELIVKASLPGVRPDDMFLTLQEDILTIKATARDEEVKGATYLRQERKINQFYRSIQLPAAVDAERAEAVFQDGILTLTLPKHRANRPRVIQVQEP